MWNLWILLNLLNLLISYFCETCQSCGTCGFCWSCWICWTFYRVRFFNQSTYFMLCKVYNFHARHIKTSPKMHLSFLVKRYLEQNYQCYCKICIKWILNDGASIKAAPHLPKTPFTSRNLTKTLLILLQTYFNKNGQSVAKFIHKIKSYIFEVIC